MSKIRITGEDENGCIHHVFVDDVELHGVYGVALEIDVHSVPTLTLKVRAENNLAEVDGIVYAEVDNDFEKMKVDCETLAEKLADASK